MKNSISLVIMMFLCLMVLTACAPPVHDDPGEADQVSDSNALWTGSKDNHFSGKHNDFIDDLMLNGNVASGGNLDGLVSTQAPGCAVGVLKNGNITYLQSYGYAAVDTGWTLDTVSPVASVSKTFTALGVMRMVEENLVELDEPIQTYLGNAGEFADVTLEELLSLSAGVPVGSPNWTSAPSCPASMPNSASADWCLSHPRVAFDAIKDDISLEAQTDKYANISFMAAGAVIDQVSYDSDMVANTQRGYEPWIWHQLGHWADDYNVAGELISLALTHSWRHGDINPYADGFDCNGNCGNNPPQVGAWLDAGSHEGWWGPAGGWSMTIGDLARFVALIDNENVLTEDSWREMIDVRTNVFNDNNIGGIDYGLGVIVENWGNTPHVENIVWHGGDLAGYSSIWFYSTMQSNSYGVAIQCNSNGGQATSFGLRAYAQAINDYARSGGNIYPEQDIVIGFATQEDAAGPYLIDEKMTRLVSPSSLHLPWLMDQDIVLDITRLGRNKMNYTLFAMDVTEGRTRAQPSKVYALGTDRYVPKRFSRTTPRMVKLKTEAGPVQFNDLTFDIGFSKSGTHLAESRFSAVLDLSQLETEGRIDSWPRLCRMAKQLDGVTCQPCDNGTRSCLPVVYEFQATRLDREIRP